MDNSSKKGDQELLEKLMEKETEISTLRKQLLDVNRKVADSNNELDIQDLMKQNAQLRNVVE